MIIRITSAWQDQPAKPREAKIKELIVAMGGDPSVASSPYLERVQSITQCQMRFAWQFWNTMPLRRRVVSDHAAKSYRTLARKGFQEFIYSQVGWNPSGSADIAWRQFHDRVGLTYHTVPDGYFSIFKELSDLIVTLLRQGANLGTKFIPDISVGIAWGETLDER